MRTTHAPAPGGVPGRVDPLHAGGHGLASPPRVPAPFGRPIYSRTGGPGEDPTPAWASGLNQGSVLALRSPYTWTLVAEDVLGYGYTGTDAVLHARVYEAVDIEADVPAADGTGHRPRPGTRQPGAGRRGAGRRGAGRGGRTLAGAEPVVLLAQFGDHRGQSVTNSITRAAAAAQARFYPDGRTMRLVEMYPTVMTGLHDQPAPLTLREVVFDARTRRSAARRAAPRRAHRRNPRRAWELALTVTDPTGVTRHVLPNPQPPDEAWEFTGPTWGRELALEIPDGEHDAFDCDEHGRVGWDHQISRPSAVRVPALLGDTVVKVWPAPAYTAEFVLGPRAAAYAAARYAAVRARLDNEIGFLKAFSEPGPDTVTELGAAYGPRTVPLDLT